MTAAPVICTILCTSREANSTKIASPTNAAQNSSQASSGTRQSQRHSHHASHVRPNGTNLEARTTHGYGYGRDEEAFGCFREL